MRKVRTGKDNGRRLNEAPTTGRARLEALHRLSAHTARLLYISDDTPGYRRMRRGKGFVYLDSDGRPVSDPIIKDRIRKLVIPPAWEEVWISSRAEGHIQATGRDARGRKQYIYHPRWEEIRSLSKFDHMIDFAEALPEIRRQVRRDLQQPAFSKKSALAFVARLLDETLFRAGNPEYVQRNRTFGLTTLRDRHVVVSKSVLSLRFTGKGGKIIESRVRDRTLARLAKKYQELPGQELLQYEDGDNGFKAIDSGDLNDYLREISGQDFTAKDFRTWGATVTAAQELCRLGPARSQTECRKKINAAMKRTAGKLGNTPSVCRKYYVHPGIIEGFEDNTLLDAMQKPAADPDKENEFFSLQEHAVLSLLRDVAGGRGRHAN